MRRRRVNPWLMLGGERFDGGHLFRKVHTGPWEDRTLQFRFAHHDDQQLPGNLKSITAPESRLGVNAGIISDVTLLIHG